MVAVGKPEAILVRAAIWLHLFLSLYQTIVNGAKIARGNLLRKVKKA
jgi:hypothetical protein